MKNDNCTVTVSDLEEFKVWSQISKKNSISKECLAPLNREKNLPHIRDEHADWFMEITVNSFDEWMKNRWKVSEKKEISHTRLKIKKFSYIGWCLLFDKSGRGKFVSLRTSWLCVFVSGVCVCARQRTAVCVYVIKLVNVKKERKVIDERTSPKNKSKKGATVAATTVKAADQGL